MDAPAQRLMCVTNSLTGNKLDKPFLLPGSIWQLKCFVAGQHYDIEMKDINRAIQLLKTPQISTDCETMIASDLHEAVDAESFHYMFILCADDFFKPCRDMVLLERHWSSDFRNGNSFESYMQKKDVLKPLLGSTPFHDFVFEHYKNSVQAWKHRLTPEVPPGCWTRPELSTNLRGEGATKNVNELWLCSGRDQVVEILVFEDPHNYHFSIHAYGDWQDVIDGYQFPQEDRPLISHWQMQKAIRQRQAARAASGCKSSILRNSVTFKSARHDFVRALKADM